MGHPAEADDPRVEFFLKSKVMASVVKECEAVAKTKCEVLLLGESGTGKEVLANFIARTSPYSSPFECVNCGAIPESLIEDAFLGHDKGGFTGAISSRRGHLENANRGTLFLDEAGDLSPHAQTVLLRALQFGRFHRVGGDREVEVNFRLISATNKPVAPGEDVREDFYYRISTYIIHVPPLRAYLEDIPSLVEQILPRLGEQIGCRAERLDAEAVAKLCGHTWPGNIRELENVLKCALVRAKAAGREKVLPQDVYIDLGRTIQDEVTRPCSYKEQMTQAERRILNKALEETGGNRRLAASSLQMPESTFYSRLNEIGIHTRAASSQKSSRILETTSKNL